MVYVLLADGFEEVEAVAPIDVLRRAEIDVMTVGVGGKVIKGSHGIEITCDAVIDDIDKDTAKGVILPGGMPGTLNLQANSMVIELVKDCNSRGGVIGAICAGPMILGEMGILSGHSAVCFPGFEEHLKGAEVYDCAVAVSDNIVTAKGAGTALEFGGALVDLLLGAEGAGKSILDQMQYPKQWI